MDFDGFNIKKLVDLLKPPEVCEILNDNVSNATSSTESVDNPRRKIVPDQKDTNTARTIEEYEKQTMDELSQLTPDSRLQPEFDIKYRQAVGTEDIFLQIGAKTPGTASCEDIILTVKLPGEVFSNMELTVSMTDVKLKGFIHKLDLPLPHSVNPDISKAQWNKDDETLVLTLRMVREFDFVNF